jgi:hypothetical protein
MNRRSLLAHVSAATLIGSLAHAQPLPVISDVLPPRTGPGPLSGMGGAPSLSLSFMNPGTLDPRVTFTRASTATYFNNAGTMQTAAANTPRWDYNPNTLALNGMLIEEARTNLLSPSLPGGSFWDAAGPVQVLGGSVVAPDGTTATTSQIISSDTTNNVRQWYIIVPVAASTQYVITAFLKRDAGNNNAYMQVNTNPGTTASVSYYDLGAATAVVGADLIAGQTGRAASITPVGNGWYRVSNTLTTPAGTTTLSVAFGPCTTVAATGDNRAYVGVVGQGLYFWGVQVEAGAFPTSYIPTVGAAVTRAIDVCYMPIGPWFNPPLYSLYYEFDQTALVNTVGGISDAAFGANTSYFVQSGFAGIGVGITASALVPGALSKQCVAVNPAGLVSLCNNGGIIVSAAASGGAQAGATRIAFGMDPWSLSTAFTGHMRRVQCWPRVLSNAELQAVTT